MGNLDKFSIDDDEFAAGAGINHISQAYADVFQMFEDTAKKAKSFALCGCTKEVHASIQKLSSITMALVRLSSLDTNIVGPSGKIFNALGIEAEDMNDEAKIMTEDEFMQKVSDIIKGISELTYQDALDEIEANKAETNLQNNCINPELDDIDW